MNNPQTTPITTAVKITDYFPIAFRYFVLFGIFYFIFTYFKIKTLQFLLFIAIFIANFFTIVFLFHDFISANLVSGVFSASNSFSLQENNGVFIKIFIGVIFGTLILQFSSLAIMIAVFDYGKKSTNSYYTATLTDGNANIVSNYIRFNWIYFICMAVFTYVIVITNIKNERIRNIVVNIGCFIPTAFLLGCSIYSTVLAVKFLDNKKYKRSLYK